MTSRTEDVRDGVHGGLARVVHVLHTPEVTVQRQREGRHVANLDTQIRLKSYAQMQTVLDVCKD